MVKRGWFQDLSECSICQKRWCDISNQTSFTSFFHGRVSHTFSNVCVCLLLLMTSWPPISLFDIRTWRRCTVGLQPCDGEPRMDCGALLMGSRNVTVDHGRWVPISSSLTRALRHSVLVKHGKTSNVVEWITRYTEVNEGIRNPEPLRWDVTRSLLHRWVQGLHS